MNGRPVSCLQKNDIDTGGDSAAQRISPIPFHSFDSPSLPVVKQNYDLLTNNVINFDLNFSVFGKRKHEVVTGNENGITEVKSVGTILPDGKLHNKSQYFKNGEWVDGHEFIYEEAPAAEVVFK